MLRILFLSLNVALLQGIPVAQVSQVSQGKDRCGYDIETTTAQKPSFTTETSYKLDPFECSVPEYFDPLNVNGKKAAFVDCNKLNKFIKPPTSILSLKGGHPMICCPKGSIAPPKNLPLCKGEDIEKYNDIIYDEEDEYVDGLVNELGCVAPKSKKSQGAFPYNTATKCNDYPGTRCKLGNHCGAKDFNNTKPPGYCGFDLDTGADKFCCSDLDQNDKPIKEPQQPLFQKDSKAYPCGDQTLHCERWIETNPESCTPLYVDGFNQNSYPFMREVCQESCNKTASNFRSNKCRKGCVDEYAKCPQWSRSGYCHKEPQFMYFHCRESCGSCGFKSPLNTENQIEGGKQYTDLSSRSDFMCGKSRLKPNLTAEILQMINDNQVAPVENQLCSSVLISDRFALTAAHCWEKFADDDFDPEINTQSVQIRDGTVYQELIGVRRWWVHPWRVINCQDSTPYYDLTIMELERRVEFNYTKYGDTPVCLSEEVDLPNQNVFLEGYGTQAGMDSAGELLQLELKTLQNEECYNKFLNVSETFLRFANGESTGKKNEITTNIKRTLYDGITDQLLCTVVTCNGSDSSLDRLDKCDAAPGDSGAPLYTLGDNSTSGEISGQYLIGIHSGGNDNFVAAKLQRGNEFFPKWWIRIAQFSKWIKCTQKHATEGKKSNKNVERACDDNDFNGFTPKCNHTELHFDGILPYWNKRPYCRS